MNIKLENRHIEGLCKTYGYKEEILVENELVENPMTKEEFAQEQVLQFINTVANDYELNAHVQEARETKIEELKTAAKAEIIV